MCCSDRLYLLCFPSSPKEEVLSGQPGSRRTERGGWRSGPGGGTEEWHCALLWKDRLCPRWVCCPSRCGSHLPSQPFTTCDPSVGRSCVSIVSFVSGCRLLVWRRAGPAHGEARRLRVWSALLQLPAQIRSVCTTFPCPEVCWTASLPRSLSCCFMCEFATAVL